MREIIRWSSNFFKNWKLPWWSGFPGQKKLNFREIQEIPPASHPSSVTKTLSNFFQQFVLFFFYSYVNFWYICLLTLLSIAKWSTLRKWKNRKNFLVYRSYFHIFPLVLTKRKNIIHNSHNIFKNQLIWDKIHNSGFCLKYDIQHF